MPPHIIRTQDQVGPEGRGERGAKDVSTVPVGPVKCRLSDRRTLLEVGGGDWVSGLCFSDGL